MATADGWSTDMTDMGMGLGAPTRHMVERVARGYGATVAMRGDAALVVTFPSLHAATSFAATVASDWAVQLQSPVTDLWSPVTLTVKGF